MEVTEPRLITEVGVNARVANILQPIIEEMGFRLVRVNYSGLNGGTLQVMTEKHDGSMTIEDCETISRSISPVLDVKDPIHSAYNLEVSSPGLDRPLVRKSDFEFWAGHYVKIESTVAIEGKKKFRGILLGITENMINIRVSVKSEQETETIAIPISDTLECRLIETEELIKTALSAGKHRAHKGNIH